MRFLIVDDDERYREIIAGFLQRCGITPEAGHEIAEATDAVSCLAAVARQEPDIITMDGYLGEDEETCDCGPDVIAQLRARGCTAKIVMVSGSEEMCRAGIAAGAHASCDKRAIRQELPGILASFGVSLVEPHSGGTTRGGYRS